MSAYFCPEVLHAGRQAIFRHRLMCQEARRRVYLKRRLRRACASFVLTDSTDRLSRQYLDTRETHARMRDTLRMMLDDWSQMHPQERKNLMDQAAARAENAHRAMLAR